MVLDSFIFFLLNKALYPTPKYPNSDIYRYIYLETRYSGIEYPFMDQV
jgi:hypothetical protein